MNQTLDRKLPQKVHFSYAALSFGVDSLWNLNTYFLLFFYTDVIRIPPAAATVIIFIARIWDAINDPMMGVICDKTHHKEGRCRYWLKRMSIPVALCFALSYFCPDWATPAKVVWVGLTYILQGMAQTAVGIPRDALRITMTSNRDERVKISQYMAIGSTAAMFLIPAFTMPFVSSFGEENMRIGFAVLAGGIGVLSGVFSFLLWRASDGLDPDTSRAGDETSKAVKQKEYSGLDLIKAAFRNKYCLLVCLSRCAYLLLSGLMGSTLIYYFRYNVGNESLMGIYSTMVVIGALLPLLVMRLFSRKFGNAKSIIIGAFLCVIAFALRILTNDTLLPVFAVAMLLMGIGSGFISQMFHPCIMDAASYGKLRGEDNQSVIMSVFTFSQKFGQAVSNALAAGLLAVFHYEAGDAPSPTILRLFYAENMIIPLVIALILVLILVVVDRMEKQLLKDLAAQ